MPVSLHTAVIGAYRQILPQLDALLDRAESYARENGIAPEKITGARLAETMWPFGKQIMECGHQSARAIEGVRKGVFSPEPDPAPTSFDLLREEVAQSRRTVDSVDPEELESIAERDMLFRAGSVEIPFTVGDFLLSFAVPNFYFHATAAYAILRAQGLPLRKMDFLGTMRVKT